MAARTFKVDPKGRLNAEDYNFFRNAKWRIDDTFAMGMEQNKYQQDVTRNAYTRNFGDLTRKYAQARQRLPGSFAGRGLLNSGLYQQALGDFNVDRNAARTNLTGQFNDTLGGYSLAAQQLELQRRRATEEIDTQEAARRAVAEALRAAQG